MSNTRITVGIDVKVIDPRISDLKLPPTPDLDDLAEACNEYIERTDHEEAMDREMARYQKALDSLWAIKDGQYVRVANPPKTVVVYDVERGGWLNGL